MKCRVMMRYAKIGSNQRKDGETTLHEVCERLDVMFQNMEYRGEDKLNIVLAALSFCISQLNNEFDDQEVANLVVELLAKYADKTIPR